MKQIKKSKFFQASLFLIFVSFLYIPDWGGSFLLGKIPEGFSKKENLKIKGNPLKGFLVSGSIFFNEIEFSFTDPIILSKPFMKIPESLNVSNCTIKTNADFLGFKIQAGHFFSPKLKMTNTCKIQITLNEELKEQLKVNQLVASVSGEWDLLGRDGHMVIKLNQKDQLEAWFEDSKATGIKGMIDKRSKWWGLLGSYPGPGNLSIDWKKGVGSFVLEDLTFSKISELKIIGSIYEDGDWSAIVPLDSNGMVGLKSDNNELSGSWEGLGWDFVSSEAASFLDIFLGNNGEFSFQNNVLKLKPEEGEYFHEIQLNENISGFLMNRNNQVFENFSWDLKTTGEVSVFFENFSWLLPKPAPWWPRGVFDGFLKLDPNNRLNGDVQILGPASMMLMGKDSTLDLFKISFKEEEQDYYNGDTLLLRLSDPELVLVSSDFFFSKEGGISAKGKVATTSDSIIAFFGQDVIGLISLFAGPDYKNQIFQIPVEVSGEAKDPKISMSGMPLRWEYCPNLQTIDCLEKRAKQNPN